MRAQIEGLVAERYGALPEDATRETKDATRRPAKTPSPADRIGAQVNAPEPLDDRDPEPRTARDLYPLFSDELSDAVA